MVLRGHTCSILPKALVSASKMLSQVPLKPLVVQRPPGIKEGEKFPLLHPDGRQVEAVASGNEGDTVEVPPFATDPAGNVAQASSAAKE